MIDTLKLNIVDCDISASTNLIIEPSPYLHNSQQKFINYDLFVDSEGEIVQGKKAYINSNKFNLTIKPKYTIHQDAISKEKIFNRKLSNSVYAKQLINIDIPGQDFNSGIYVQTSLPRYENENNFKPLSIADQKSALNKLEKDLRSEGIKTNIWNANLSRLDIFSNIQTDETFSNYSEIFSMLDLTRMQRFEYAGTTFLFKNGEQQICCYDKMFEMQNKNKNFKLPRNQSNVLRIENRLLKKRKILNVSGFCELKELYKNYDFFKVHYRKEVGNSLFKYEPKEIEIRTVKNIKEEMEYFSLSKNRKWFDNFCRVKGLEHLLKLSSIEVLFEAVESLDMFNRFQKSRIKKKVIKAKLDLDMMKASKTSRMKSNAELYNELKSKFYKAVA